MPECPRCGRPSEPNRAHCAACGTRLVPDHRPAGLPRIGAETLVLGSGAALPEPAPPKEIAPDRKEPRSAPRESAPPKPPRPSPQALEPALRREPRQRDDLARRIVQRRGSSVVAPAPSSRPSRRRSLILAVAGIAAVAAAATIALLSSRASFAGNVTLDAEGHQLLVLECRNCADGTLVELQGASGRLESASVNLPVEPELPPGHQRLTLSVTEPGKAAQERLLDSTVLCRFTPDLAPLSETPPRLAVRVEALGTASVVLDGHAVKLDDGGQGSLNVDLGRDLSGPADKKTTVHRRLPFTATAPGITPVHGQLELSVSVVPLRIDAPGDSIVIDTESFMLAGATQSGGSITVEGRPITVDPSGHFAQRMSVSSVGERTITVRASTPGLAPRLIHVTVRRVASLSAEAERFAKRAETSYAAIAKAASSPTPPPWEVALAGRISDLSIRGQRSQLDVDVVEHCAVPPCRARVDYGARVTLAQGDDVRVGGKITGSVRQGDAVLPRIEASIVAPGADP